MKSAIPFLVLIVTILPLQGGEFRHFADFILKSRTRILGTEAKPVLTKPVVFNVSTDGVKVRITVEGNAEGRSTFDIYRSDGIARQLPATTNLDIMPGLQATSNTGGVLRHLRLTRESMTITTFSGRSDQTMITYAVASASGAKSGDTVSLQSTNP